MIWLYTVSPLVSAIAGRGRRATEPGLASKPIVGQLNLAVRLFSLTMTAHKNVLLIVADDLGKYVGAYGCKSVKTPNIDALAAQGSRFTHAFASTASCSGSRSTLYTGLHTHENGQYGLNIFSTHFQTFDHVDSAPRLFNHGGYLTGILGKIHVGSDSVYNYTVREESTTRDVSKIADRAEAFFKRSTDEGKPFFLTIGWIDPHRDVRTRGGFGNQDEFDARVKSIDVKPEDVEIPTWLSDLPETRQEFVEYYQAIHRTDQGVGFVLAALERAGLADSTLVVFTSDNGPPFINAKTTLYDAGTCLPFIVRQPGGRGDVVNPNMISYIDVLPTFLDYAGLGTDLRLNDASPSRIGRSFLPILEHTDILPGNAWQQHVFGSHTFHEIQMYWPTRVMRSRQYKYHHNIAWRLDFPFAADLYASYTFEGIRNDTKPVMIGPRPLKSYLFRPDEELYDLEADPQEVHNLAKDPKHQEVLLSMRQTVEAWQKQTRDLWLFKDGVSLEMLYRYGKEGLKVPDRFDIDADEPGTKGLKLMKVDNDARILEKAAVNGHFI